MWKQECSRLVTMLRFALFSLVKVRMELGSFLVSVLHRIGVYDGG